MSAVLSILKMSMVLPSYCLLILCKGGKKQGKYNSNHQDTFKPCLATLAEPVLAVPEQFVLIDQQHFLSLRNTVETVSITLRFNKLKN
jgi:hypothetical protein